MYFKQPKTPSNICMYEMQAIIGGHEKGMTQKSIKNTIDLIREMRGTYKGKGISTNTISRMLGATHGAKFRADTEHAWYVHNKRLAQHGALERVADQIKDPKERERFLKFGRQQMERQKGKQYELEVVYLAESDEFDVISG